MAFGSLKIGKTKEETPEDAALRFERALEIHGETLVVDGHNGMLFDLVHGKKDVTADGEGHLDLPRLRKAGVGLSILTAFLADRNYPRRGVRAGLLYVDAFRSLGNLPGVSLCMNGEGVEDARRQDKTGFMLGFEGGEFLDGSISALRMFARLGLRLLTLTWSERNSLGDGAAESGTRGGLTSFGKQVVKECGDLGVIVDTSHISEAGFWDVVDEIDEPFVASHSNCHALYAHPRNLTDDQIKAIAESGGIVGITLNPEYLGPEGQENDGGEGDGDGQDEGQATVAAVCDHIIHAIEVAGEESVGLGTDFDTFTGAVPIAGVQDLHLVTAELLKRGVSGKSLHGILGGNWLRVIRAVCR